MAFSVLRGRHGFSLPHINGIYDPAFAVDDSVCARFGAGVSAMQSHVHPPILKVCGENESLYGYKTPRAFSQKQVNESATRYTANHL